MDFVLKHVGNHLSHIPFESILVVEAKPRLYPVPIFCKSFNLIPDYDE